MTVGVINTIAAARKDALERRTLLREHGACVGESLFIQDALSEGDKDYLKSVCASCPVFADCDEYALKYEQWGFWAGINSHDERQQRRRNLRVRFVNVYGWDALN
jgi:hypothetical protein